MERMKHRQWPLFPSRTFGGYSWCVRQQPLAGHSIPLKQRVGYRSVRVGPLQRLQPHSICLSSAGNDSITVGDTILGLVSLDTSSALCLDVYALADVMRLGDADLTPVRHASAGRARVAVRTPHLLFPRNIPAPHVIQL